VLIILGLAADTAANHAKTGDVNANLWAGIGMVAVAGLPEAGVGERAEERAHQQIELGLHNG
jgi:hypothetical protein